MIRLRQLLFVLLTALTIAGCGVTTGRLLELPPAQRFEGEWLLTMPSGHEQKARFEMIGREQLILTTGGNLSGKYQLKGNQLVIVDPADKRFSNLAWQVKSHERLILTNAPSASRVGSNYVGALLTR